MYQGYVPETHELCTVFSSCWSAHHMRFSRVGQTSSREDTELM